MHNCVLKQLRIAISVQVWIQHHWSGRASPCVKCKTYRSFAQTWSSSHLHSRVCYTHLLCVEGCGGVDNLVEIEDPAAVLMCSFTGSVTLGSPLHVAWCECQAARLSQHELLYFQWSDNWYDDSHCVEMQTRVGDLDQGSLPVFKVWRMSWSKSTKSCPTKKNIQVENHLTAAVP